MQIKILPSLLAADFGNLEREARRAEEAGADALHLDIMDGHFVPNISMGPDVVAMARAAVSIPLSVHLMLSRPQDYLRRFRDAGADSLLIHVEARCDARRALETIRALGMAAGITLNPATSGREALPYLDLCDEILCMSVQPGYGGQSFMPGVIPKIKALREATKGSGRATPDILVDGGIDNATVVPCAEAGANAFVAGTSLFREADMTAAVAALRKAAADVAA